eukprot:15449249-Alexandrium_andersonii.AAC.1
MTNPWEPQSWSVRVGQPQRVDDSGSRPLAAVDNSFELFGRLRRAAAPRSPCCFAVGGCCRSPLAPPAGGASG